jgi:hypothetical protein
MGSSDSVKSAEMIQYRGRYSETLIRPLIESGAEISVFLQHPATALLVGASISGERLYAAPHDIDDALSRSNRYRELKDNLSVYRYLVPAALSAVKIDDRVVMASWYIHDPLEGLANHSAVMGDLTDLRGHDNAAIVAYADAKDAFKHIGDMIERHLRELRELRLEPIKLVPKRERGQARKHDEQEVRDVLARFLRWIRLNRPQRTQGPKAGKPEER